MKVKVSEPDLRTEEEIQAAREASRPDDISARGGSKPKMAVADRSFRNNAATSTGSAARTAS